MNDIIKARNGKKINILIIGPNVTSNGGVSSVIQNYLSFDEWQNSELTFLPTFIDGSKVDKILFFLKALLKLRKAIKTTCIDIAHIHIAERGSFFRKYVCAKLLKKHNKRIILQHHGAEFNNFYLSMNTLIQRRISSLFKIVNLNIVLGKNLKEELLQISPEAKVSILHNAVTVYPKNPYNADASIILFLGHLSERKGIYDLVKVIKRLDAILDPKYTFALCGEDVVNISSQINELGLSKRICHLGWIGKEKKEAILADTVIHVLPSYNECLPMAILETMSYGIPNISTSIASIPEVILNGINGFLIEPGDTDSLYDKIIYMLNNTNERNKFSNNSYNLINENFSLPSNIQILESLYEQVYNGDEIW